MGLPARGQWIPRRTVLAVASGLLEQRQAQAAGAPAKPLVREEGSCATCIGDVDGTLGSCAGLNTCISTYDDRPEHFVDPWEVVSADQEAAIKALAQAIKDGGGSVESVTSEYVRAHFGRPGVEDIYEFLFPAGDDSVSVRAVATNRGLLGTARLRNTMEQLRVKLGWDQVYVLRNRKRLLGVFESPFDSFGPTPPLDGDIADALNE